MKNLRLSLFAGIVFVTLVSTSATPMVIQAWQRVSPQPLPSPNAPSDQNALERLTGPPINSDKGKEALDRENQIEIRLQVQRLYAMATELKDEVDRTNSNTVMNVAVLKRAQEIEKLAKQIRERAKK
jgi:hypothetical protein